MSGVASASFLSYAALAATAVGAVTSAVGAISAGNAQADAAGRAAQMQAYQSQVARNNEQIARQQADREIAAGQRAAEMESQKTAARLAKVRAGFGARGVDVNSGSALDVQASERELGKLDAETVLSNAQVKAYGYQSKAVGYRADADLNKIQEGNLYASGDAARSAGYLKAGGTLLSSASSLLGSKWGGGGTTPSTTTGTSGYTGTVAYSGGDYPGSA